MQLLLDSTPASTAVALFAVFAGYDAHTLTVASGPTINFDNVNGAIEVLQHLASKSKSDVAGVNEKEKKEIAAAIKAGIDSSKLAAFNTTLNSQSFVAASSHRPSVADFVYWAAVGASLTAADFSAHPNVARWARYLLASVPRNAAYGSWVKGAAVPALPAALASKIFEIDIVANAAADSKLRSAPAVAAPAADKKAAAVAPAEKKAAAVAPAAAAAASAGDKKAEKKEKPAKEAKPAAPAAAAEVSQVYRVDFRVAKILSAAAHPTEARLLVLQVDVGAEAGGVRTVVSGLAEYYKMDELANRLVVCIVNLKAGDLKGVVSAGRLMVATGADGKKELATPPAAATVGERISFASVPKDKAPDAELAGKRFNDILKLLKTDGSKNVCYGADVFTTTAGSVTVPSVADGIVA